MKSISKQLPFLFILLIISCNTGLDKETDFSSPKKLFVDLISSYTSGIISSTSEIKVRLTKKVNEAIPGEKLKQEVLDFEPSIAGFAYWEDAYTVVFKPEEKLEGGQKYKVKLKLDKLLETSKDKEEFRFVFRVMPQNFEVTIGDISFYDSKTLNEVKLSGMVHTADFAENSAIEKMLNASQNGAPLKITWEHGTGNNKHRFVIEEISRTDREEQVQISWSGESIAVNKEESVSYTIPALGDYKVLTSAVINGEENYIAVRFSDPLMEDQNLQGLIQLHQEGKYPRTVIQLNELKIYPASEPEEKIELTLYKDVKNIAGDKLQADYKSTLEFFRDKPEIKLDLKQNAVILPGSEGLILPFQAVGLREIDVTVIRIYEENVLQYLQVNNLGGTSEIKRVGRPVAQKVIPLYGSGVVDLNKWNRFTLDLAEIMEAAPGAVYQINLNFRKSQSLYFCAGEVERESEETLSEGNWDDPDQASYWDYYDYNYEDYDWEQRENPCSNSYYRNRDVSKVLFASDIGIIAKKADHGNLHVFVSNLLTTEPQSAEIEVYDYQQQLIATGKTSAEGVAEIELNARPFAIIAKQDDQRGYLKLNDGGALSLSNFDVSGQTVKKGIKGFIYGERGVWRPGDTLHLSFILEDKQKVLPEGHPVILELFNPKGQLVSREVSNDGMEGIYSFSLSTSNDAPTGNWRAKVKVGGVVFSESLKIETVKPNRLKINLDFGKDRLTALDNEISADLKVRWLHGAKANQLRAQIELLFAPITTTFQGYSNFDFDDESKEFYSESRVIFDGRVDSEGNARINIPLKSEIQSPGALKAIFKAKAFEEGGDFSIDQFTIPHYPYASFVGINAPEGDDRGLLLTDEDHVVKIVTLDARGKKVGREKVKVELYKLDWRWWWDNSYENISNYVGRSYQTPVQEDFINTANGEGSWKLRINHPEWGRYFIKATDPVSGHSTGHIVAVDWPGWAKGNREGMDGVTMLNFTPDKKSYKVGETVKLSIPSSAGGRALVSLESGSKVIETFWVPTNAGNTEVTFETTAAMAPNIYAHVMLIQPHGQTLNDLPIRLYGVQAIEVTDPSTKLQPEISMPGELRPESSYKISVKEKNGKAMAYTLAVVEEGLLDLTRYKTPAPWTHFYAREALGVKTWDMYNEVIGAFGGKIERLLAVGGDDEISLSEESEVNRFKPVVKYLGPFFLEAGKTATHQLEMPQYIGSVRTMVVAARDGAYGSAETATPVKQPLMVLATLPRVAGPGEKIVLPVNIFTTSPGIKQVKLHVKTEGLLEIEGAAEKTVNFSEPGDQLAYFTLNAAEALGPARVVVTATSGNFKATYDVELNIRASNPPLLAVQDSLISAQRKWNVMYQPLGIKGTNEGVLEISTLPPLNLEQRLQFLVQYPHGCVEQIVSSVFAQLYLDELTAVDEQRKTQIERNINQAIKSLLAFQLSSGGLAYWPGNNNPNAWGTNYAGHFLLEAKNKGYHVPDGMLSSWIAFQQAQAEQWVPGFSIGQDELIQAYRLYTLALAGKPALGAMNRMKERSNNNTAQWRLALAYAVAGYEAEAKKMVQGLTTEVVAYDGTTRTYGSRERDKAMILETLVRLGDNENAFQIIRALATELGDAGKWMSTQTTAYSLIAIAKYAEKNAVGKPMDVKVRINNREITLGKEAFISQVFLQEPSRSQNIIAENNGQSPVYARVIRRGVPLTGDEEENQRNIRLMVNYTSRSGEDLDVEMIKQGTDFLATVTVHNNGLGMDYSELALSQIFPSGWEIINTRLDGTQQYYNQGEPDYQDIRDDRVYTYFDLKANEKKTFTIQLNASYRGRYYLPAVAVEAMYDNSIYANKSGLWVEVVE